METRVVTNLNPALSEMYLAALRGEGLRVYMKELYLDAMLQVDIFLVYDTPEELARAEEIVKGIEA